MSQSKNEIVKYLKIVYRHRYLFVVVSLIVMTLVTTYSYTIPKQYQSDSTVFIEKSIINNLVKGIAVTPDIEDRIRVLRYALLSRDIITKVLEDINSNIFTRPPAEQQQYINELREDRININIKGRDLFIVSLVDKNPAFAQSFVNTLVSKYVEETVSSKREESYGANRFLEEQLATFKQKLDEAEDAIIEFRRQQGIYLSLDEGSDIAEIKDYTRQVQDIDLELETLQAKLVNLISQADTLEPTVEMFSESSGLTGEGELSDPRIMALESKLQDLLLRYTENYPEVVRLQAEITALKKRATEENYVESGDTTTMTSLNPLYLVVQQNISEVKTDISSLQAKKRNLQRLISEREKNLHEVPAAKKQLTVLTEQRDSYRELYQELLQRKGQSEVTKQMEISDKAATYRVVDPANYPETPVSPNMIMFLLAAIGSGVGCGIGVAVLLDFIDSSVKDPIEIESLGVDILATIPNISDGIVDITRKKKDRLLYLCGGAYLSVFVALLLVEFLQLDLVQKITGLVN